MPSFVLEGNLIRIAVADIIASAMMEIGALAAGETPSLEEYQWGLRKLQRLIDRYNARRVMIWNVNFLRVTPPAGKQPVTIGPNSSADIDVTNTLKFRPVEIIAASLILPGNPEVEIPLGIRDDKWWSENRIKGLTSTYPTDLYYSPDWAQPNSGLTATQTGWGNLYFWPIPTAQNDVRLECRTVIAQLTNYNDVVSLPPAYWDLLVAELAIGLCPSFNRSATPELLDTRQRAIKAVQANNISSPRLDSDAPTQDSGKVRPDFNFLTGGTR